MSLWLAFRYGHALRKAQVAQVEVRMRISNSTGAWRMVVSFPSGAAIAPFPCLRLDSKACTGLTVSRHIQAPKLAAWCNLV